MEAQAKYKQFAAARAFGMIVGVTLALLLSAISVTALFSKVPDHGGGLGYLAIFIGGPLFLIALGIWIYLVLKGAAGHGLEKIMWIPVAASMAILPVAIVIEMVRQAIFNSAHPVVHEVHINLTGRTIALDPGADGDGMPLDGKEPRRFTDVRRDPWMNNRDDKMLAYDRGLPAPGFNSMKVYFNGTDGAPTTVPVRVMPTPPLWQEFSLNLSEGDPRELVHFYYHYPDRVEVVTTLGNSVDFADNFDRKAPVTNLSIHNLGSEGIVRVEVNGQPLFMMGDLQPVAEECYAYSREVIHKPETPITLRWQTAGTDPQWRQGTVTVPQFKTRESVHGSVEAESLHLYVKPDGTLSAQREQTLDVGFLLTGTRVTAVMPPFPAEPPCSLVTGTRNEQ